MTTFPSSAHPLRGLPPLSGEFDVSILKKFRDQANAPGGVWIFMRCVAGAVVVYLSTVNHSIEFTWMGLRVPLAFNAATGAIFVALGVFACPP
jgi:hypothetical protein